MAKNSSSATSNDTNNTQNSHKCEECEGGSEGEVNKVMVKRGRVELTKIGEKTRKGGYRLTLTRYKHFASFWKSND